MPEYSVVLIFEESTPASRIRMFRETFLPFPPYPGMNIRLSNNEGAWEEAYEFTVGSVAWDQDSGEFICESWSFAELGDEPDDENDERTPAERLQESVDHFVNCGWTIAYSHCKGQPQCDDVTS